MAVDIEAILEATAQIKADTPEPKQEQGDVSTQVRTKGLPRYTVYHLTYDAAGNVVDYHIDRWRCTADALIAKLNRRYEEGEPGAGQPIWTLKLPTANVPKARIPCRHPRCTSLFRTIEDREIHVRAHHRDFYLTELERERREEAQRTQELIKAQTAVMERILSRTRTPRGGRDD